MDLQGVHCYNYLLATGNRRRHQEVTHIPGSQEITSIALTGSLEVDCSILDEPGWQFSVS